MRAPVEYPYMIDGEHYCLREATFEGQERIAQAYALSLTLTPGLLPLAGQEVQWAAYSKTLEAVNGANLYAKAVTQECLVQAPDVWWTLLPASAGQNGTPRRAITFRDISAALWTAQRAEVTTFLEQIFRADEPDAPRATPGGAAEPAMVAPVEALPAVFRGRAE
jgi:hypothetical protein